MAIKPISSSQLVHRKEGTLSPRQMMRTTSEKFKSSSHLLNDAIKIHEEREQALLATNQKLQEQIDKFQASQEEMDGKHQKECLIYQKKICELTRGIESFSGQLKPASGDIGKTLERILHCQDQVDLCEQAIFLRWRAQQTGRVAVAQAAEILKNKLDPEYQARVNVDKSVPLFAEETKSYARSVQGKLEMIRQEFETLEGTAKTIAQELKQPES